MKIRADRITVREALKALSDERFHPPPHILPKLAVLAMAVADRKINYRKLNFILRDPDVTQWIESMRAAPSVRDLRKRMT